jgi:hypothetical protein
MSLKDAIREAANARDHQGTDAVNTESNKAVKQSNEPTEELAAMTVRVSRRHRLHWLISAKKERTTLTAAITEALNARFGEPSD